MISLSVHDTTVSYTTKGEGTGLVLLHGTNSDGTGFNPIVDLFTDQRKVIIPDYAGCGRSTIPEGVLQLDLLVEQIAAVIRNAHSEPVDLVGNSLGAVVAASLAATYPDLVRRLILVVGFTSGDDARHHMIFETLAKLELLNPKLGMCYAAALAFSPEYLSSLGCEQLDQLLNRPSFPYLKERYDFDARVDIRDQLASITSSTLIIGATYDYLVPPSHSRDLHQRIKGSQYTEVTSGHCAFIEKPDEVVGLIRDFILD